MNNIYSLSLLYFWWLCACVSAAYSCATFNRRNNHRSSEDENFELCIAALSYCFMSWCNVPNAFENQKYCISSTNQQYIYRLNALVLRSWVVVLLSGPFHHQTMIAVHIVQVPPSALHLLHVFASAFFICILQNCLFRTECFQSTAWK